MKIIAVAALTTCMVAAAADGAPVDKYGITPAEHAACDADAVSLCSNAYPDVDKLLVCMKANVAQLSRTCLVAFKAGLRRRRLPM